MLNRLKRLAMGTLRRQLVVGMTLVFCIVMSLFVWDQSHRLQTMMLEQQTEQAVVLARSVATSAAVWVASRDYSGLQGIIDSLEQYPDLQYAIVLDVRGQILAHNDPTRLKLYLTDLPAGAETKVFSHGGSFADVASPVMLSGNHVGWVRIGLGDQHLAARLADTARRGVFFSLVGVGLSSLLSLLAGRYLTRRLYAIQQVADAVQTGESDLRADVTGDDEAAHLARQFNGMLDSLAQRNVQLKASEQEFLQLFMKIPVPMGVVDEVGTILRLNDQFTAVFGYTLTDLPTLTEWQQLAYPDVTYRHWVVERWNAAVAKSAIDKTGIGPFEYQVTDKNGKEHTVLIGGSPLEGRVLATFADITERKRVEANLRIAATAFESQVGMTITNADKVILRVNRAFTEINGYSAEEAVGQTPKLLSSGRHDAAFYAAMWKSVERTGTWQGEIWNRRKNGEVFPEWLTVTVVKDDAGLTTHYVGTFSDISLRKAAEEQINTLAFYDPLTRLPNRRLLMDRLEQAMAVGARHRRKGALLFIDLDNFKEINDTLGHYLGDGLLQQVAKRLVACVREVDTVARLGGDEFVVLLENLSEHELDASGQATIVGEKILNALNQAYLIDNVTYHSSASIGLTLFGGTEHEAIDEPLKRADMAMYQAKTAGRNTMRHFDPQMQAAVTTRAMLDAGLREALDKHQFLLYYQTQVSGDARVTGAEVLVRWRHPQRGIMSPAEFIPLAEETGLILPLGLWVLETACSQLARWASRPELAHLTIAVNVSARQFHQDHFVDQVLAVLARTGANPHRLKLELTESLLISSVEKTIQKMATLKGAGVAFSLDDFGTGYSSLAYLKRLPLDQLKIDQSFVRDVLIDPNDAAIAKMIIVLAETLGLTVIAEGVETKGQWDFLSLQGCHAYQGYFFSRPMPLVEFEELVAPV